MSSSFDPMGDCSLIARFCQGDIDAWHQLYFRHQEKLLQSITYLLGRHGLKRQFAEDVAQDVWLALLDDAHHVRLKRYDPSRGSFHTYLTKLALRCIRQGYAAKRRRTQQDCPLGKGEPLDPAADDPLVNAELAEFLEDLTPQERRCLHEKLMNEPSPAAEPPISASNERVLKHRLQRKLRDHMDLP
jgi:RNA polymerase sigma factor (sigma-70 family)